MKELRVDWEHRHAPGSRGFKRFSSKKQGTASKEESLTKPIPKASKENIKLIKKESKRREQARDNIGKLSARLEQEKAKLGVNYEPTNPEDNDTTYRILNDIKSAYKKVGGSKKLVEAMQDDKQFASLIKELIKMETALKTKRDLSGGDGQAIFVVIKGLEDERALNDLMHRENLDVVDNEKVHITVTEDIEQDALEILRQAIIDDNPVSEDDDE